MSESKLRIAVGIATAGRRDMIGQTIGHLKQQTRLPDLLIICPLVSDNVAEDAFASFPAETKVVSGPVGLCAQRNLILSHAGSADVIVFFDDDFLAEPTYLAALESIFANSPDVCASTGVLLADDATGPGMTVEKGLDILRDNTFAGKGNLDQAFGLYGCNMAFRTKHIWEHKLRFDENLPLYGWQEDVDFSLQIAPYGRLVKVDTLLGVHLGTKKGKTSGVKLGYSQIANPVYLCRKGTMSWRHARKLMFRNFAANLARSLYPEPWIDRVGRLKGNTIALVDVVMGRASPKKIMQLS
jgi:glycosyltransferase involved in cell wall biosynthesis